MMLQGTFECSPEEQAAEEDGLISMRHLSTITTVLRLIFSNILYKSSPSYPQIKCLNQLEFQNAEYKALLQRELC